MINIFYIYMVLKNTLKNFDKIKYTLTNKLIN